MCCCKPVLSATQEAEAGESFSSVLREQIHNGCNHSQPLSLRDLNKATPGFDDEKNFRNSPLEGELISYLSMGLIMRFREKTPRRKRK